MIENVRSSFQDAAKLFAQFAADQNIINTTEKVSINIAECFRKALAKSKGKAVASYFAGVPQDD